MTMTTEETKRVRVKFPKLQWDLMLTSLRYWSEDAKRKGYDTSVENATPVIDLVQKKLEAAKTDEININLTYHDLKYLHIGLGDCALFLKSNDNLDQMRTVAKSVEDVVMAKFGQRFWSDLLNKTFNWQHILDNKA